MKAQKNSGKMWRFWSGNLLRNKEVKQLEDEAKNFSLHQTIQKDFYNSHWYSSIKLCLWF